MKASAAVLAAGCMAAQVVAFTAEAVVVFMAAGTSNDVGRCPRSMINGGKDDEIIHEGK